MAQPLDFDPIAEAARQWQRRFGDPSIPSMSAAVSIMRVHQILMARLNEAVEPYGLTFPRSEALMMLFVSQNGSLPMGKIGVRLQVHAASVTSLIDGLESLGYVTRTPHPQDRRTVLATITDEGRRVAAQAAEALNGMDFGMVALKPAELVTMTNLMKRLRQEAGDFVDE